MAPSPEAKRPLGLCGWTLRIALIIFAILTTLFGISVLIGLFIDLDDPEDVESARKSYSGANPWRELPSDQMLVIEEVLFVSETLRDTFQPTSMPGDDYDFMSSLVRNLETRTDITWIVLEITGLKQTMLALANRIPPVAEAPFDLAERFAALHRHWSDLERNPWAPRQWEKEFDTTRLPPLMSGQRLGEAGHEGQPGEHAVSWTLEQRAAMDTRFAAWFRDTNRKLSYLKDHPPHPMAWVTDPRRTADSEDGGRAAWNEVLKDGVVEAGRAVSEQKLDKSPLWKPIFRGLMTERVPWGWLTPGEKEMTDEEFQVFNKEITEKMERVAERMKVREEYREKLKEEVKAGEKKEEL